MKRKARLEIKLLNNQDSFKAVEMAKKIEGVVDASIINFSSIVLHYDSRKTDEETINKHFDE